MSLMQQLRRPQGVGGARLVLGLGAVSVWLVLAAFVGALAIGGEGEDSQDVLAGPGTDQDFTTDAADAGAATTTTAAAEAAETTAAAGGGGGGGPAGDGGGGGGGGGGGPVAAGASGGDSTGVSANQIKIGVHAPLTFSGVPLNLAEDPVKGLKAYIEFLNQNDGINGRKIALQLEDDRFETTGARTAGNALINDGKNFMVSGTLGIDQVAVVAAEAARRGVPYTAAGGAEELPIPGMRQLGTSYTTHVLKLAQFIASDADLRGKRIGILVSDSQYIKPVATTFQRELERLGQTVSTIVPNQKPQQNPNYQGYILQFRRADTEVVVPLTDPITTQQIVQGCAAGAACGWTYAFSNFAHDSDTALALMTPTWSQQRVKGLSAACYYQAPEVNGGRCANMKTARAQYIAIHGEGDWNENGSGASFGYQIVGFLKGALAAPGADLTRERFQAALNDYAGYSDLVSGPITFRGTQNYMHGAEQMAVWQAQSNNRFKMISPGLVDGF